MLEESCPLRVASVRWSEGSCIWCGSEKTLGSLARGFSLFEEDVLWLVVGGGLKGMAEVDVKTGRL